MSLKLSKQGQNGLQAIDEIQSIRPSRVAESKELVAAGR